VHLSLLAAACIVLAVYGSLVPLQFTPIDFSIAMKRFDDIPMLKLGVESRADWVANILLFVPIGFFVVGALSVDRSRRSTVAAAVPVVVGCFALSVAIEFTQLWFPTRTVSQNDVAAETIGGLMGCLLWIFTGQTFTNWLRTYAVGTSPMRQIDWLLQAYLLGLVVYSIMPLDVTISVTDLYGKFASGRFVVVPFTFSYGSVFAWVYQMAKDMLIFAPIGAWSATAFVGRGQSVRSLGQSVLIGGLIVAALELAQLFVFSRFTDTTDIVSGTVGVALGAALMRRILGGKSGTPAKEPAATANFAWLKWLGVAALYAVFLTAGYWFPFDFSADNVTVKERLARFFCVPFSSMYAGSEYQAISNLLQKTLLFVPLGALVTIAAGRIPVPEAVRRIFLAGLLLVCCTVAFGIELGQVLSPRHTPDVTDVILCTAGALAGMVVTARLQRGRKSSSRQR
jgi:glycopeptide antibiotics resistance protein